MKTVLLLIGIFLGTVGLSYAQQPANIHRIGFLSPGSPASVTDPEALRQGLRELRYVEGKNIQIEWRFAEGKVERLADLASELVHLNIEVNVGGLVFYGPNSFDLIGRAATYVDKIL